MGLRKIPVLFLVLTIVLIAIPGCNSTETDSLPRVSWDYEYREGMSLSLSPVPKLGETAELTFDPSPMYPPSPEGLSSARVWVEFYYANTKGSYSEAKYAVPVPLEDVLVSGELSWKGNALEDGAPIMHATVQLPREGVWLVFGFLQGKGWEKPVGMRSLFAVTEDAAAIIGTPEFDTGPLGYLAHFYYGTGEKRAPDERRPVVLELDISKLPTIGEEVTLTCRINSIIDYEDYSAEFHFVKLAKYTPLTEVNGHNLLVDGDLNWEGDLKKGKPVEFSATVKLPECGIWIVEVLGDDPESPNRLRDEIDIIITNDVQYFVRPEILFSNLDKFKDLIDCL